MKNDYEANHDIGSESRFYDENGVEVYHTAEQERKATRKASQIADISDQEVEELCAQLVLENFILENLQKHSQSDIAKWEALNTALETDIAKHKRTIAELKHILSL